MTRKRIIIIIFLIQFTNIVCFNLYSQVNLSNSSEMSELPFVLAMPNGQVMVAWTEGHFNGWGTILYRIYTEEKGWSETRIAADKLYSAAFPQLASDNKGQIHMAYMDGNSSANREIYYKKYVNGKWTEREMVYYSPGLNSSWPRIDVEGDKIYIIWCHNYTPPGSTNHKLDVVLMEKKDGGNWPSTYQNVSRLPNSVSVHPFFKVKNENLYVAWMDDNHSKNNWNIYYTERINGKWAPSIQLFPGGNQYTPALAVDNHNNVHLIFSNKGNPVWYMKKSSSGWSSPVEISTARTSVTTMSFIKFSHGKLHAAWRQKDEDGDCIYYGQGNIDGVWDLPIKVSSGGQSEYPCLDVDSQGRIHIVYSDIGKGGERDIYYVRLDKILSSPVASFEASPLQGLPPLTVNFDASKSYDPDGKIVSYKWDFGDDSTPGSGVKISHTYNKKGNYEVKLTVYDDENNYDITSKNIIVGIPPHADFTCSPNAGAAPLEVSFDASLSYDKDGYINKYEWDFGDGDKGQGVFITHVYKKKGTYIATLTVTDNDGFSNQKSVKIDVSSTSTKPKASFVASPLRGTPPLKVEFDASNSKPGGESSSIIKYEWDFGDGHTGTGKRLSHIYKKPDDYTVTLKVTNDKLLSDSATKIIVVFTRPTASFTLSPSEGIAPLKVKFDASSSYDEDGKIVKYKWNFGDGTKKEGMKVEHTYTWGGIFTVTLQVVDDDGYTSSVMKNVKVIDKPYPPKNVRVGSFTHEGLFITVYGNIIEWQENPQNEGKFEVVKYRIFRKKKSEPKSKYYCLKEVSNVERHYQDTEIKSSEELDDFSYAVKSVDSRGRESEYAEAQYLGQVGTSNDLLLNSKEKQKISLKSKSLKISK